MAAPTIFRLTELFGKADADEIWRLSRRTQRLENYWAAKFRYRIAWTTERVLEDSRKACTLDTSSVDFIDVVMRHSHAVLEDGIRSSEGGETSLAQLSGAPPTSRIPRSLEELRKWWDRYRKGKVPKRQAEVARKLAREYLERLRKSWREHSDEFLSGNTFDNTAASEAIKRDLDVSKSRADMIVATETTYYFNRARREIFDQSPDVTHYLFVAIRDHRTTKWCKTRDGLVYAKGDPLLEKETPPIHWNCRSEMLPLSPKNPLHLRLIEDATRQRRAHVCEPLPPEWNKRA